MTFMSISYKPMKSKFHTTIITKSWPMKFVIINLGHPLGMTTNFNTYFNQNLTHGKTWNFLIYSEKKSTWPNFNYLHDDIWTKEILTRGTWNKFWWKLIIYLNLDFNHPLWLFNLNVFILWRVAQSKIATWHNDWILEKNKINNYLYKWAGR